MRLPNALAETWTGRSDRAFKVAPKILICLTSFPLLAYLEMKGQERKKGGTKYSDTMLVFLIPLRIYIPNVIIVITDKSFPFLSKEKKIIVHKISSLNKKIYKKRITK